MEPQSLVEDGIDDNTYLIAKSIFTGCIQKPKFYSLQLEPENEGNSLKIAEKQGIQTYIQNILSIITVHGIKLLYSHCDINKLTESQIQTVKMYVKSYGYILEKKQDDNGYIHWKFKSL